MINDNQNTNWITIASIWLGGMISIPSLLIGSALISGLDFISALVAGFLGIAFVTTFMCLESLPAFRYRLNTVELAKSSFGNYGAALLIGSVVGLATMGWFGVQTNIAGISFSKILADTFAITFPVTLSSAFWGIVMLVTAVYGLKLIKWLNYIAVPAIILLMIYGLIVSFQGKGWSLIIDFQPEQQMSFISAIGLTIGFVSVGGVISPDINRFAKSRKDLVLGSVMGLLPAGMLLLAIGAILSILQGTHDITEIFSSLGYPILALSILILATWTTNVINAYSGGLALNQFLMLPENKRPISTLIAGIIGTAFAIIGILDYFLNFLLILTATIPPIAGVLISDFWLSKSFQKDNSKKLNWMGFVAWATGLTFMLVMQDPIKNLLTIFISAILYWLLNLIFRKK